MVTIQSSMTLEDYLSYDNGTDTRYKLVDGVLVEMPPKSTLKTQITAFLLVTCLQMANMRREFIRVLSKLFLHCFLK
jgi:Uma2 family endonuclease